MSGRAAAPAPGPSRVAEVAGEAPRILFVTSAAFNSVTGGGITFSNLFAGWPRDRIATIHNDPLPVTTECCERFYALTPAEVGLWRPLRRLRPSPAAPASGPGATGDAAAMAALRQLKRWIYGDGLPERGHLTPALERWIEAFRPDILYSPLGSNGLMELVAAIQRRFALPLVVHFMDDWQSAIYRGGLLSVFERRRMRRMVARLVGGAADCLGIGDAMCTAYEARFGRPFHAFQNTLDAPRWMARKPDLRSGRPVRALYTGAVLGFAQAQSLADCAAAVGQLRAEGMAIALDIHAAGVARDLAGALAASDGVRLRPPITDHAAYFAALSAADLLLLPANFDAHSRRYIRYSMPTKVPSYLVSGTPVLVYGPPDIAQVDDARRTGWGHVVDRRDGAALRDGLRRVAEDLELRRSLVAAAQRLVLARHDSAIVRTAFQRRLVAAARS